MYAPPRRALRSRHARLRRRISTAAAATGDAGYKDGGAVYAPPFFLWQGVYAGGFAGVAWSSIEAADNLIILTSSGVTAPAP